MVTAISLQDVIQRLQTARFTSFDGRIWELRRSTTDGLKSDHVIIRRDGTWWCCLWRDGLWQMAEGGPDTLPDFLELIGGAG